MDTINSKRWHYSVRWSHLIPFLFARFGCSLQPASTSLYLRDPILLKRIQDSRLFPDVWLNSEMCVRISALATNDVNLSERTEVEANWLNQLTRNEFDKFPVSHLSVKNEWTKAANEILKKCGQKVQLIEHSPIPNNRA